MNALVLVDIQNDFLPGGALAVAAGQEVIPVANKLSGQFDLVLATQDWHPPGHMSFASQHPGHPVGDVVEVDGLPQVLWPDHCVQDTYGAELAAGLDTTRIARVIRKGSDPRIDSYSGFFDNGHRRATGLGDYLRQAGVTHLCVVGLTTDVCVKFTALDARQLGFEAAVVIEGVRAVEVTAGDGERAMEEMTAAGVQVVSLQNLPPAFRPSRAC